VKDKDAIIKLIEVLGKPHTILIYPFELAGDTWEGIRISDGGYEIFKSWLLPPQEREIYGSDVEEIEYILPDTMLEQEDEEKLRKTLEGFL